jgi:hypothetical protein
MQRPSSMPEPPFHRYIRGVLCIRSDRVWVAPSMTKQLGGASHITAYVSGPRYTVGSTYACDCWYKEQHFIAIIHQNGYEIIRAKEDP